MTFHSRTHFSCYGRGLTPNDTYARHTHPTGCGNSMGRWSLEPTSDSLCYSACIQRTFFFLLIFPRFWVLLSHVLPFTLRRYRDIFHLILVIILPQFLLRLVQMCTVGMNDDSLTFLHAWKDSLRAKNIKIGPASSKTLEDGSTRCPFESTSVTLSKLPLGSLPITLSTFHGTFALSSPSFQLMATAGTPADTKLSEPKSLTASLKRQGSD